MRKPTRTALTALIAGVSVALLLVGNPFFVAAQTQDNAQEQTAESESDRSWPPDTTPYVRPVVPEDYAPGGREAIPPEIFTERRKVMQGPCRHKRGGGSLPAKPPLTKSKTKSSKVTED